MSLLAAILELDEQVFLSLNSLFPASSDTFWLAVTKTITWIPLYIVILARLIKTAPNHSTWLFRIALTIVGVLIWDQGAGLFKEWIARPRPCQEEIEGIRVLVHCSPYG